jgi:E3 ubiquitin-protein ligase SHPRH
MVFPKSLLYSISLIRLPGISCLRIDQNRKGLTAVKKFASSEDINVLLLHGYTLAERLGKPANL